MQGFCLAYSFIVNSSFFCCSKGQVFNIDNTLLALFLFTLLLGKEYPKEYLLADLNSINFISLSWSF